MKKIGKQTLAIETVCKLVVKQGLWHYVNETYSNASNGALQWL